MLKKLTDFVVSNRLTNALYPELPKGTQVVFKLPSSLQQEINGKKISSGIGWILERKDGVYTIGYQDKELKVKPEDIFSTKEQAERLSISDDVKFVDSVDLSNPNDVANMFYRLLPSATDEVVSTVSDALNSLGAKEGDTVVCYISDDIDDYPRKDKKIETIQVGDVYFNAFIDGYKESTD